MVILKEPKRYDPEQVVYIKGLKRGPDLLVHFMALRRKGDAFAVAYDPESMSHTIRWILVNGGQQVAGFALPGNYVDILVSTEGGKSGNRSKQISKIVLEHVLVLAIAQETYVENGKAKVVKTVTLEVTPKEAETLALGTHEGTINLVLRNPLEKEPPPQPVVAKRTVTRPRVYRPRPQPFDVEVIRRSHRESISFKTDNSEDRI